MRKSLRRLTDVLPSGKVHRRTRRDAERGGGAQPPARASPRRERKRQREYLAH